VTDMNLKDISSPQALKGMKPDELKALAGEIRETIMGTVSHNGGHLASNLGIVELTLALHRTLDCPKDQLVFDVGHQCYAHKLLTGRYADFPTLRQLDGLCGFPRREESEYDSFGAGHASTAISAALGMARARDLKGEDYRVVAVVGDGALTGGMCYEALNDAGSRNTQLTVILNDNGMSISRNVGALSGQLTRLRVSRGWMGMKKALSQGLKWMPPIHKAFQHIKNGVRNVLVKDKFFTALGFHYFGPIDGHDLEGLERVLMRIRDLKEPVLLHVVTQKGRGFTQAEQRPEAFHGVAPLYIENGIGSRKNPPSLGSKAGEHLTHLAKKDQRVCAVCAAMADGTGFSCFEKAHPDRFFDVGIAEEHAVTLAAGMAAGGLRPFVAIYETFLQRAFDQIMEDVCLQGLPVCFLMDRAGLGGEDGATHHGIYGIAMLHAIPGLTLLSPRNEGELTQMMDWALTHNGPVAIRYPRNGMEQAAEGDAFRPGRWQCLRKGTAGALISYSTLLDECLVAADYLVREGMDIAVYNASSLNPLDEECLKTLNQQSIPFYTVEEHALSGGLGSITAACCARLGIAPPRAMLGLPVGYIPHGSREGLLKRFGLHGETIAQKIKEAIKQ